MDAARRALLVAPLINASETADCVTFWPPTALVRAFCLRAKTGIVHGSMDLPQNNPAPGSETAATTSPDAANVRGETFNRIRRSLLTTQLALAEDVRGGDPYESRRGRNPGGVWGKRRR